MTPQAVLLYGGSLLLSLVTESLTRDLGLHVTRTATWEEASRSLAERTPDVLVFDLINSPESHILPLLLKTRNLLLIGLDPEQNQALLLPGQEARSLTIK